MIDHGVPGRLVGKRTADDWEVHPVREVDRTIVVIRLRCPEREYCGPPWRVIHR
jgi:hypothetical protein